MSTYAAKKNETLVDIMNLKKWYPVQKNIIDQILAGHTDYIRAVDGVTFKIHKGEAFGLAGESGSGKTTIGKLAIGMELPTEGKTLFDGIDLAQLPREQLRLLRRRMQVIFRIQWHRLILA